MTSVLEPDWQTFKKLHSILLDRFCVRHLEQIDELLGQPNLPPLERFQQVTQMVAEQMQETQFMFDDMRRSTARFKIYAWYRAGLLGEADLAEFTQEMQEHLDEWSQTMDFEDVESEDEVGKE